MSSKELRRLVIPVSFSGDALSSKNLFIARVLFSALIDYSKSSNPELHWKEFTSIPGTDTLVLEDVLFAIMEEASAEHVILCVNDIANSPSPTSVFDDLIQTMYGFRLSLIPSCRNLLARSTST
jgi:hypothetical protein